MITAITYIARRLFRKNNAVMNLLPSGRTLHSTTPIPRKSKENKHASLSDFPMKNEALMKLRDLTGMLETGVNLMVLNSDELGMQSHRMLGWCSQRFKEATGDFEHSFGALPIVNLFGDFGQLGPIGARNFMFIQRILKLLKNWQVLLSICPLSNVST